MYVSLLFFLIHHVHCFDVIGDWDASILYQWPNNIDHRTLINLAFFFFLFLFGERENFLSSILATMITKSHLLIWLIEGHAIMWVLFFFCCFLQIKPTSQMPQTNRFQLPKRKFIRELKRGNEKVIIKILLIMAKP